MIYLVLSVLLSSFIFVLFKLFSIYKVETNYAIVINYIVACTVGLLFYKEEITFITITNKSWFWQSMILGFLFIVVFNLMATTSQKIGVSVASVASKMSLVLPILFGFLFYNEKLSSLKIIGILLALAAVYYTSQKGKTIAFKTTSFLLPFLVFIGSGTIDISLAYFQKNIDSAAELSLLSTCIFGAAAIIGCFYILSRSNIKTSIINYQTIIGGICLGIPNYFSIYCLLRALQNNNMNNASVFTLNNVAIVLATTLLGIVLFREKMSKKNFVGIALAVFSIILIALFNA